MRALPDRASALRPGHVSEARPARRLHSARWCDVIRCCSGATVVHSESLGSHVVLCADCDRVLTVVAGRRDEVFADL